jgi:hypothetical protein
VEGDSNILSQATNAPQWAKPTDSTLVDRAIASTTYVIFRHHKAKGLGRCDRLWAIAY